MNIITFALVTFQIFIMSQGETQTFDIISSNSWQSSHLKKETTQRKLQFYDKVTFHFIPFSMDCSKLNIQELQQKHKDQFKLDDIGFNFIINSCGNVFEGRSLMLDPIHAGKMLENDKSVKTAFDPNSGNIGVALLSSNNRVSTDQQLGAALLLIEHLRSLYPIQHILNIVDIQRETKACHMNYVAQPFIYLSLSEQQEKSFHIIKNLYQQTFGNNISRLCVIN